MTDPKVRLPILVEASIGRVEVLRYDSANAFESKVRTEVQKSGFQVTCEKGCASCCYHPIAISILEGILIYRWLLKNGSWTISLKSKLAETAEQQFGTTYEVWLLSLIPCPLLDSQNQCIAYSARPLNCRAYFSISDPYLCHPHRLSEETLIVPRDLVLDSFNSEQEKLLRKHKLQLITMPIGAALLMAEKVCTEKIDLDTIDSLLIKQYAAKG